VRTPRLVGEEDGGALAGRSGAQRRVLLLLPPPDPLRVLLVGAHQRALRGQADPPKQLPDALRGVLHAELPLDEIPDDVPCPQREVELELPGIPPDNPSAQPRHLPGRQFRFGARRLLHFQGVGSAGRVHCQPSEHGRPSTAECKSRVLRVETILDGLDHAPPSVLELAPRNSPARLPRHGLIMPHHHPKVQ